MKKLFFRSLITGVLWAGSLALTPPVFAQGSWDTTVGCMTRVDQPATLKCLEPVFANLVSVLISLAGIALFVMLTIGGFKYLTSAGNAEAVQKAKDTMFYAIIGLVIMVCAVIIMQAIKWFTGVDVLRFEIPTF